MSEKEFGGILISYDVVKVDYIPSVNNTYIRTKNKVILSSDAKDCKKSIYNQLGQFSENDELPKIYLKGNHNICLYILFLLNPNNGIRDTDNMIKLIQDCLQEYYKFNDKIISDLLIRRRFHNITEIDEEFLIIKMFAQKRELTIDLNNIVDEVIKNE